MSSSLYLADGPGEVDAGDHVVWDHPGRGDRPVGAVHQQGFFLAVALGLLLWQSHVRPDRGHKAHAVSTICEGSASE